MMIHLRLLRPLASFPASLSRTGAAAVLKVCSLHAIKFHPSWRLIHASPSCHLKSTKNVHVTIESKGSTTTEHEISSSSSNNNNNNTSPCSLGITSSTEEEEEEQEEMFVIADPVLGLGNNREWGGPRRGGSMPEPTRFGDWERKGRCTDF